MRNFITPTYGKKLFRHNLYLTVYYSLLSSSSSILIIIRTWDILFFRLRLLQPVSRLYSTCFRVYFSYSILIRLGIFYFFRLRLLQPVSRLYSTCCRVYISYNYFSTPLLIVINDAVIFHQLNLAIPQSVHNLSHILTHAEQ